MSALEITTMIGCPQMCKFCPQDALKSTYDNNDDKYLSLENFKYYLSKIPSHVSIHFSGMAEPWANKQTTKMLEYTLRNNFNVSIYSTLIGMSENDADRSINLIKEYREKIEKIVLHLPDNNGNMTGYIPREKYFNILRKFIDLKKSAILNNFEIMTMDGSGKFHSSLTKIIKRATSPFEGISRAGALSQKQIEAEKITVHRNIFSLSCASTAFYDHNVLLPNGDVALCCMDYELKHILGNLKTMDYYELFDSNTMRELKLLNQRPEFSKCSICKSCNNVIDHSKEKDYLRLNQKIIRRIKNFFAN